jgi:type I restriction enzyme S subunit
LISSTGHGHASLKRVLYQEGRFALGNLLAGLVVREPGRLLPRFLALYLNVFKDSLIVPLMRGAANMSLTLDRLSSVPVAFPSMERQVAILSRIDAVLDLLTLRRNADGHMQRYIPALFHEMFGSPVTDLSRWPMKPLGDLLTEIQSGWSPKCREYPPMPGEWGVLKLGAITSGRFLDSEAKTLPPDERPRPDIEIKQGDILFTRKNTYDLIGATAFVHRTKSKLMFSDLIFRLCVAECSGVLPSFLWATLSDTEIRRRVQRLAAGTAGSMPNISKGRLKTVPIPIPPLELQTVFDRKIQEENRIRQLLTESDRKIEDLRASIVAHSFAALS